MDTPERIEEGGVASAGRVAAATDDVKSALIRSQMKTIRNRDPFPMATLRRRLRRPETRAERVAARAFSGYAGGA